MPRNKKKIDPKWFNQPVSESDKNLFKRAMANYIAHEYDDKHQSPHANVQTYLNVLHYTSQLIPKWSKVNKDNFSTHNFEAHKTYAHTLRNLLSSNKMLKEMLEDARTGMDSSDIGEGPEKEDVEIDHHDSTQIKEKPIVVGGRLPVNHEYETPNLDTIDPDTILRKPGEKRPRTDLMIDDGEHPIKIQRLEELERAHSELINAHDAFQNAAAHYKALKASIPFINSPNFIKSR